MSAIDYSGRFHARGVCTDKGSSGALGFPIKASTLQAARDFANQTILDLLPGWGCGSVRILEDGKFVESYLLERGEK